MSTGPSLYRRHRPRTFADVVGQEHVVRTLKNAVNQGKVHHAYLFVGSRGTGKTSMAKILAACLNCMDGPTTSPCGICESCVAIQSASSLDVIEMDAASNNSVDDIRDLREKVTYAPVSGRHKVYILDEAHMLSQQAWNAFLKTLEEPPPRTIFVLATTEAQKILPTVVDRCHRFDFGRPTVEQVGQVLGRVAQQEKLDIDGGALALLARNATGSFRDALGTLEQLVTYAGTERIQPADVFAVLGVADAEQLFAAIDATSARDPARALRAAAKLAESGRDPGQLLRDLEVHGRELLTVQVLGEVPPELRVTPERDQRLLEQAQSLSEMDAVRLLDLVSAAIEATANGAQARIQLELVLIKAAAPEVDPATTALIARIERLEAGNRPGLRAVGESETAPPPPAPLEPSTGTLAPPAGEPAAPATSPGPAAASAVPAASAAPVVQAPAAASGVEGPAAAPGVEGPAAAPGVDAPASNPVPSPPAPAVHAAAAVPVAAAAPQVATALSLQMVADAWPAVIDLVRGQNAMLAALLADARPVDLTERELTVAFPPGAAFLKRKAEQDDHRRVAAEAFRKIIGQARGLRFELREADEQQQSSPETPVLSGEELVRRFLEEFDAEELLEDEPDERKAEN